MLQNFSIHHRNKNETNFTIITFLKINNTKLIINIIFSSSYFNKKNIFMEVAKPITSHLKIIITLLEPHKAQAHNKMYSLHALPPLEYNNFYDDTTIHTWNDWTACKYVKLLFHSSFRLYLYLI